MDLNLIRGAAANWVTPKHTTHFSLRQKHENSNRKWLYGGGEGWRARRRWPAKPVDLQVTRQAISANLFLAGRLRDPVEVRDVRPVQVAVGVALDDAVWVGVVGRRLERDDGQRVADELASRHRLVVDDRRDFQLLQRLHRH